MSLLDIFDNFEVQSRDDYIRAPFSWPGGKWRSLQHIIPRIKRDPKNQAFIEPCGGSGVVMLNMPSGKLDVFNDRHAGVVAFYRCLRDASKIEALKTRLDLTVHSREEFVWSKASWKDCTDDVERAARWYYTVRMSFASLGRNFGRSTNGKSQQPGSIHEALEGFDTIHRRFRSVQIENQDLFDIIRDYDSPSAVFYLDPNYIDSNPGVYKDEITIQEHRKLLEIIFGSKGTFYVSGYPHEIYDRLNWTERFSWKTTVSMTARAFTESNNLAGMENAMVRDKDAEEVLWVRENS